MAGSAVEKIERRDAPLRIRVMHHDAVASDLDGPPQSAAGANSGAENRRRELQRLEFLCIGEATDAVPHEHEVIAIHDCPSRRRLGMGERVLDHFEDDVERRERETLITVPSSPSANANRASGCCEVPHQVPVELRLAMSVVSDRRV